MPFHLECKGLPPPPRLEWAIGIFIIMHLV